MEIKLSRLKQIISEVVEERHASGRMDDIIQSTRGEEVDPRDQALDEMIAEEIEAAIEKFVVGEAGEYATGAPDDCAEIKAQMNSSFFDNMDAGDRAMSPQWMELSGKYNELGCAEAQGGEQAGGSGGEIKPDVQKVADRLGAVNTPDEFAQLIDIILDLLSDEKIKKALPGILKRAGLESTEKAAFAKAVMNHGV